ncbi:MAG: DUF4440 domain-containing protein, partial [Holophagales bacterium]|nr:DUF4440 domain-containing protein [Holophagales bacterium]
MLRAPLRRAPAIALAALCALAIPCARASAEEPPPKILGSCTVAQLEEAPYDAWYRPGHDGYTPKAEAAEALGRLDLSDVEIEVFFGTWCGDSRREVPRLIRLLEEIGLPETSRRLIAVDNDDDLHKRSPGGEEKGLGVFRVPTIRVLRGGEEVGRIVEHPARSLELDLLTLLEGQPYRQSYATYPVVRGWLEAGLLADPNSSADGLAGEVRALAASEWELYSAARVLATRGQAAEAAKLMGVNCSIYRASSTCHTRLARYQLAAGDRAGARESAILALEHNDDPDAVQELVRLLDPAAGPAPPTAEIQALEQELRETETAFAAAFAAGDMEAFASFLTEHTVFMGNNNPLRGKEAIVEAWTRMRGDEAEPPFTWRPERVAIEGLGLRGLSTGPVSRPDGRWFATFVSTWQ